MRRVAFSLAFIVAALFVGWQASAQYIGEGVFKAVPAHGSGCAAATTGPQVQHRINEYMTALGINVY